MDAFAVCGSGLSLMRAAVGTTVVVVSMGYIAMCEESAVTVMCAEGYLDNAVFVTSGVVARLPMFEG